jgi:hypothetical protein
MSIRAASLLVALCVAVSAPFELARHQEDPRALADAFVGAANDGDRAALQALVHPDVVAYLMEQVPERWEEVLSRWAETRFDDDYHVTVRPASDVEAYDEGTQALVFGGKLRFRFPVLPPSHFFIIQNAGEIENRDGRLGLGGPAAVEAARQDGGRWYITVPVVEILPD